MNSQYNVLNDMYVWTDNHVFGKTPVTLKNS